MRNRWLLFVVLGLTAFFMIPRSALAAVPEQVAPTSQVAQSVGDDTLNGGGCVAAYQQALAATPAASHNSFTVIGDSWGFLYYGQFKQNMIDSGYGNAYQYYMRAIPGTEASQWVSDQSYCQLLFLLVKFLVRNDTGTPRVMISLGGNDLVNDYDVWGMAIYDRIESDLRTLVNMLIAERSDVIIIFSGYDIVNMYKSQYCTDYAVNLLGSSDPAVVNPGLIELGNRQAAVAADYPNVYYANSFGALQGTPGNPNVNEYSPLPYFVDYPGWEQDCIHMNLSGYDIFTQALVDWMAGHGVISPAAAPKAFYLR